MKKIGIIGVGSVGGAIASRLVALETAREIVLIDTDGERVRAAAMDLIHAAAFGTGVKITAGKYRDLSDADVVVISAGANQKPGQTRADLIAANAGVMIDIVPKIMAAVDKRKVKIVVVSNPLDSIVMAVRKLSGLPPERVIGTGTMLDTARLRAMLGEVFDISPASVGDFVLGEHGDSSFVYLTGALKISATNKNKITLAVRNAAYEIIKGRGATWDGIAAAATDLIRAILNDERRVLPVSIVDKRGVAYSLPRVVSAAGATETMAPDFTAADRAALSASINAIKKTYRTIE
ncbi:MAG: NAD(P)-binding domain-containing protein [Rickettsiales bacterium]|jgi:L-lactate dehydrogenase|nr:NAD(P)-binding domain-containing protein [Rickettsiales bacterium]